MSQVQVLEVCRVDPRAWAVLMDRFHVLAVKSFRKAKKVAGIDWDAYNRYMEAGRKAKKAYEDLGRAGMRAKICFDDYVHIMVEVERLLGGGKT